MQEGRLTLRLLSDKAHTLLRSLVIVGNLLTLPGTAIYSADTASVSIGAKFRKQSISY